MSVCLKSSLQLINSAISRCIVDDLVEHLFRFLPAPVGRAHLQKTNNKQRVRVEIKGGMVSKAPENQIYINENNPEGEELRE